MRVQGIELKKESGRKHKAITDRTVNAQSDAITGAVQPKSASASQVLTIDPFSSLACAAALPRLLTRYHHYLSFRVPQVTADSSDRPPLQQPVQHQHDPSDTTKWYRASPEHLGRVGFITSMSR